MTPMETVEGTLEAARMYGQSGCVGCTNPDGICTPDDTCGLCGQPGVKFHPNAIQTYSGEAYDFQNPDPATIKLRDIAHALSNACRYAGHTARFYSVAEHSVLVMQTLKAWGYGERIQRVGLMHDAHEAYVWDCPRPFKPLLGETFREFGDKADEAICEALDLPGPDYFHAPYVKEADTTVLVAEATLLMHHGPEAWSEWKDKYSKMPPLPDGLQIVGLEPWKAENAFLHYAHALGFDTEGA